MTIYLATTKLSRHDRANYICYQVNKRAMTDDFMGDEGRVRETLNDVAEPRVQDSLDISIEEVKD